jgi:hypothetical protein
MADSYDFDYPWRPIYEWRMTGVWLGAASLMLVVTKTLPVPSRMGGRCSSVLRRNRRVPSTPGVAAKPGQRANSPHRQAVHRDT